MHVTARGRWLPLIVWPYYVDQFQTDLGQAEVARRLRTLVTPHSFWIPPNYSELKGKFIGRVHERKFTMMRLVYYVLGYFPLVRGRIIESQVSGVTLRIAYLAPVGYIFLMTNLAFSIIAASEGSAPILVVISIMLCGHIYAGQVFCKELATTAALLRELLQGKPVEARGNAAPPNSKD